MLLAFSLSGKDGKDNWAFLITKPSSAGQKHQKKKGTLSDKLFVLEPELYLNSYSMAQVSMILVQGVKLCKKGQVYDYDAVSQINNSGVALYIT